MQVFGFTEAYASPAKARRRETPLLFYFRKNRSALDQHGM